MTLSSDESYLSRYLRIRDHIFRRVWAGLHGLLLCVKKHIGLLGRFTIGSGARLNGQPWVRNYGMIVIGKGFVCNSGSKQNPIGGDMICRLVVYQHGCLVVKDRVGISNSTIVCQNRVVVGNNVLIGGGCRIWDTDFHSLSYRSRTSMKDTDVSTAPVIIEDGAFIGGGSFILKGVTIGQQSVVAAGSIVTKCIPPGEIWGGNPAKFIRKISPMIDSVNA